MNSAVFHKEISHSPLTNVIIQWLSNYKAMDIHHNDFAELEKKQRETWKYCLQQHYYNIFSLKF